MSDVEPDRDFVPSPDEGYRRLHPITPFLDFINILIRFLLPAIVFLIFSRGIPMEAWVALAVIPATLAAVLQYVFYQYRFTESEIVVKEGVFSRRERHIPYERIQNIDVSRNLIHRLLGLAEASVETASGKKPEAVLSVLSLASVEEMRARVRLAKRTAAVSGAAAASAASGPVIVSGAAVDQATSAAEPTTNVFELQVRDLFLLGTMSNRSLPIVAGVWGTLWQFDFYETEMFRDFVEWVVRIAPDLAEGMTKTNPLFLALSGLTIFLVLRFVSLSMTFASLYGFRLSRSSGSLRTQMGLFTRYSSTVPIRRIQALQVRASLWQRMLQRVAVRVETAGSTGGALAAGRRWIVPLVSEEGLGRILDQTQPESSPDGITWRPLHPKAITRLVRRHIWIFGVIATPLLIAFREPALPILFLLPLLLWRARSLSRFTRYGLTDDAVFFRTGWLNQTTTAVLLNKIQAIDLRENPFDRKWQMASLHIDTASSGNADWVRIPFLPVETAHELRDQLTQEAGKHAFQW